MSRTITLHHDGHGLTESITIEADDLDPNSGAASHEYWARIAMPAPTIGDLEKQMDSGMPPAVDPDGIARINVARIQFQRGPRNVEGSQPGIVEAVLLGIVLDRMRCFNAGPYSCRENSLVATKIEEAMHWLKARADERAKRGVLGKNEK